MQPSTVQTDTQNSKKMVETRRSKRKAEGTEETPSTETETKLESKESKPKVERKTSKKVSSSKDTKPKKEASLPEDSTNDDEKVEADAEEDVPTKKSKGSSKKPSSKGTKPKKKPKKEAPLSDDSTDDEADAEEHLPPKKSKSSSKKAQIVEEEASEEEGSDEEEEGTNELDLGETVDSQCGNYRINRARTGFYTCTCEGFKFKKGPIQSRSCKHIKEMGFKNKKTSSSKGKGSKKSSSSFVQPKLHTLTKEERENILGKNVNDLKDLLRKNDQKVSGNKGELIERVLHCAEYGGYPNCPTCGTGRVKPSSEGFTCPGYMDDTDWVHCGFSTDGADLTFPPFYLDV